MAHKNLLLLKSKDKVRAVWAKNDGVAKIFVVYLFKVTLGAKTPGA